MCVMADGVKRGFLSINFQAPGPSLHVCKDDIVVVDLTNEAEGAATAIHWHGIRQLNTQFMDGAPFVTQCPIPFGQKFRYAFHADDEGTHFYHSHAGHQKANGIYGALIVRAPHEHNPNKKLYDFDLPDHLIIATDWMHHLAEEDFPGVISRSVLTESILINGHGRYYNVRTLRNIPQIKTNF
jgi:FtsP/CotA-like multicopper oxidase with cupredoxin domain